MSNQLPTPYQQFIHKSRYARWIDSEQRRENWGETVDRYVIIHARTGERKVRQGTPLNVREESKRVSFL
jgi:hypothetical protein